MKLGVCMYLSSKEHLIGQLVTKHKLWISEAAKTCNWEGFTLSLSVVTINEGLKQKISVWGRICFHLAVIQTKQQAVE